MLEVTGPEVIAELRSQDEGEERERFALSALRAGVLAMRAAGGQVDAACIREAGSALMGEVRELLSTRVTEMNERVASTMTQYLDPQSGALPQRLHALVGQDGELERLFRRRMSGPTIRFSPGRSPFIWARAAPSSSSYRPRTPQGSARSWRRRSRRR